MEIKAQKNLEEAKAHFYAWRMPEAYLLLRRFFDRLPFQPQKEHAEYIGIFVRVLCETGKLDELKFYVVELEKLYARTKSPAVGYPLGVVYSALPVPRPEAARALFEEIVRNPAAREFHGKAKMMLADYFNNAGDTAACRVLIDSIEPQSEPTTARLVEVWNAVVLRRERKAAEARDRMLDLIARVGREEDWYSFFCAKLILAMSYLDLEKREEATAIYEEIRQMFEGRGFKSIQTQLMGLEKMLERKASYGKLMVIADAEGTEVRYAEKSVRLKASSPGHRLMALFVRQSLVDKPDIVKSLYQRQYQSLRDDKLIYYHVHSLRKRLRAMGLPSDVISHETEGYRLTPELDFTVEGENDANSRPLEET